MNALIRNIPVIVLLIMVSTCIFVDFAVVAQPRHLLSKIPMTVIVLIYAILLNVRLRGEKDK